MAERYIPEHRRSNFKAKGTFKQDELRRRREEQQVEIRKQKREENLAKRRNLNLPGAGVGAQPDSDDESAGMENQVASSPILPLVFGFLIFVVSSCLCFVCCCWRGKMPRGICT